VVLVPLANTLTLGRVWGYYALTEDPYNTPKLLALAVLVLIATGAWLADVTASRRGLRVGAPWAALGAFVLLAAASTLASPDSATSFFGASSLMTGALTWGLAAWTGVLVAHYLTETARFVELSHTVAITGALVASIALLQAFGADPLGTRMLEGFQWMIFQGMSTTGNPNYTGAFLVLPLVVSFALALAETGVWWRRAMAASAVICAAALFNTLTRAAWLGALAGVVVLVLSVPGAREQVRKRLLVAAGVIAGVIVLSVAALGPAVVGNRIGSIAGGLNDFAAGRLTLWSDTARVVAAHPMLGSGADRLGVAAYPLQTDVLFEGSSRLVLQDPHSLPLLAAAIFGIPAALALIATLGLGLKAGIIRLRAQSGPEATRTLYAGWFAALVGLLVTSLASVTTITFLFALFLTLGVVVAPTIKRGHTRVWPTLAGGVVVLALVLAGVWGTWMGARASHEFMRARLENPPYHLAEGMRLTPWDSRMIVEYLWRKVGATQAALTGDDVATAHEAAAELDTEIRLKRLDFPDELFFYRLRIEVYRMSLGYPGYQPDKHLEAADEALARFPNDPEFVELRQEALAAQ
jgi:hypothetical protein